MTLHHLDASWRPSDIQQREGRILRQGNQNAYVSIFRCVTEGSFDAYMSQTLETKARFISQVMTGDVIMRRAEDVDSTALNYAEVKATASGNPMVIENAQVDAEVILLTRLKRQHLDGLHTIRLRIRHMQDRIAETTRTLENLKHDLSTRIPTRGDQFCITIKDQTFHDRTQARRQLVFMGAALKSMEATGKVGKIGGFAFSLRRLDARVEMTLHGRNTYEATVSEGPQGSIASIEHALDGLDKGCHDAVTEMDRCEKQHQELSQQADTPFEHQGKLIVAEQRQQELVAALDLSKNQASVQV